MKYSINLLLVLLILGAGCQKDPSLTNASSNVQSTVPGPKATTKPPANAILIDASKDGGTWWFPQGPATGFNANQYHQGKPLADYLRSLGFVVDELPRGATITTDLLKNYTRVVRATAFFSYSPDEITAYQAFLEKPSSLFLISDHLQNSLNDQLSASLGLLFEGAYWGPVTTFNSHPITSGVSSVEYIAGSVIRSWDPAKIIVLGYLNSQQGVEGVSYGAMGIVNHPTSRIFFLGDINGIEQVPQPFTSNLMKWLFQ